MSLLDVTKSQGPMSPLLVTVLYTAPIPLANALVRQDGFIQHNIVPLLSLGAPKQAQTEMQKVVTLAAFYVFVAYVGTAGLSIAGQAMGKPDGYKNSTPRLGKESMTGLSHRLVAVHQNLLEIFPAFALCAAVTLVLPNPDVQEQCLNYLVLHVLLKTCVYIPAYTADLDTVRSLSHFVAIGSLLGLLIKAARDY